MFDKIITLIIIFYILKSLYRFFSGEDEKKRGTGRQPHIPPARPTPSPSSKTDTRRPAPRQDFPSTWREVGQILRDLKREAEGKQEGIKIPEAIPIPQRGEVSVTQHKKIRKDDQKDRSSTQKKIHPKRLTKEKLTEETVSPANAKAIMEERIERAEISFDQPGLFLQGIILSEILRPPMARRNHLLPPYLRG